MNLRQRNYPPWSAEATLAAGDATKTVKAAPGAGKALVVTHVAWEVITSAAQATDLQDTSGTKFVARLPVSPGLVSGERHWDFGLQLTTNEAFIVKPGAAGPSVHVYAEGYVIPVSV